jgi:hypothetical protein
LGTRDWGKSNGNKLYQQTLPPNIRQTLIYLAIKAEMYAEKRWWRGGREIAAFEEGREFLGQDPNNFFKHTFLYSDYQVN